jgi:glycosyltransferase involved in cell wall biosynthesis/GT2 family glycosyltransferase
MKRESDIAQTGVVVIGRNEEKHLRNCLDSIPKSVTAIVYVDSGSTDSSRDIARAHGAAVVELCSSTPFSAARARNAGLARLTEIRPETQFIQFLDGDCELATGWLERAEAELSRDADLAVACGRRRERHPETSPYNRLCDLEWDTPVGETDSCGGDALMRREALEQVGGYSDALIAGEEPELCLRLRQLGFRIVRLDHEMTRHDADMHFFSQWWTRAVRAGHAFAEVSGMHTDPSWPIWRHELRSVWFWALWIPIGIVSAATIDVRALGLLGLYPLQALRILLRSRGRGWSWSEAALFSVACLVAKFAQALGALRFLRTKRRGAAVSLIEYRPAPALRSTERIDEPRPRIAELINQYPQASHTFVRREIEGLESAGFEVLRFSIRETTEGLADPTDRAELEKTRSLLGGSKWALLGALVWALARNPLGLIRSASACLSQWSRSERGLLVHAAYLAEACLLFRWCREGGLSWIHAHFGTNAATVARLCRRLGGPPFSFTVHGPEEFDHPHALSLPDKMNDAAFTVAISEYGRSQLMRWADQETWPRIHVVRCGIPVGSISSSPEPPPDTGRLLCVARLAEQKGLFVLLDAMAALGRDGVPCQLRIIGDGPLRAAIEKRIRELDIEEVVTLLGWQDGETVLEELRSARGFVLPSFAEGLPVVLMEALGAARPVVTTYVAGIPELVEDRKNGWLVPAGSSHALARAMRPLLETPSPTLAEMGAYGAARVAELHDAHASARRLGTLIQTSLGALSAEVESPRQVSQITRMEHADA